MYDCVYGPAMKKDLKKIKSTELKQRVSEAIMQIRSEPSCGEAKVGDLAGFCAYRFSCKGVSYRIGYRFSEKRGLVAFSLFDTRENFYSSARRLFDSRNADS